MLLLLLFLLLVFLLNPHLFEVLVLCIVRRMAVVNQRRQVFHQVLDTGFYLSEWVEMRVVVMMTFDPFLTLTFSVIKGISLIG